MLYALTKNGTLMKYLSIILSSILSAYFLLTFLRFVFVSRDGEMADMLAFIILILGSIYYTFLSIYIFKTIIQKGNTKFIGLSFILILVPLILFVITISGL